MKVLSSEEMQRCDRAAIDDHGIAELVLMENAGVQVVECMEEFFGDTPPELVAIMCGKGNNGGDGFVVARHLHAAGSAVRAYLFGAVDALSGSVAENRRIAASAGIDIVELPDESAWQAVADQIVGFDCIVDALFGTGVSGPLRGHFGDVVEVINDSGAVVVAVDLPSGLSADSGEISGPAVVADLTVTFAAPKRCHALAPACELIGELNVVDIGIPVDEIAAVEGALELITPEECGAALDPRDPDTHKGSYGRVLIVGGAPGMAGAAALAARGALRGGAGLVTVAAPDPVADVVAGLVAEALVRPHAADAEGGLSVAAQPGLQTLAQVADVLAVGPGAGTSSDTQEVIRDLVGGAQVPVVLDADGLNAFSGDAVALRAVGPSCVLTPHPGETGRLLGRSTADVQNDRLGAVRELAERSDAIVVLKGYRSLVCDARGRVAINPTGNPGMATGGSGDVLTGLIAALIAQGLDPYVAARVGVFLHGEAGDIAVRNVGEISLIASDIIAALPDAFMGCEI
jgi:NAD(P)H-hydrate epimerase